jgi:hypothetical protein
MNPLDEIKTRLQKYPHVKYESSSSSITVFPLSDSGFAVDFTVTGNQYTVSFNGWHEEFTDATEALNCFAFGLSDECRLKECRRGQFAYKWTVESKQDGEWVADSETALVLFPFWRRAQVVYLQNNIISRNQR